uniref:Uncharacterized protein n=1 Tax=Odontella aurita TaxID=265563 RepID=A0A7S4HML9_9STRA|mmetsp:Transcript_12404/g.36530  ORF Transcript_12404/g.36530 Transcript_12404/m.36530 type:complete len:282 (+) Transcript_12404:868-1713(+)
MRRYELPTDDPSYEPFRIERMKQRKPRFAKYELDRMSARELRSLACSRLKIRGADSVVEKRELIRTIVESGKIEVISAPEPVERQNVAELRAMGVGKLRRAMEEAGVFFDPIDVVEKEDMVQIFVKSGRVVFREEEAETETDIAVDYGHGSKRTSLSEEGEDEATSKVQHSRSKSDCSDAPTDAVEVGDDGDDSVGNVGQNACCSETETMDVGAASHAPGNASDGSELESSQSSSAAEPAFASRTVSELRALGREFRIDLSTCIEKKEMVDKLAARVSTRR